MGTPVAVTGIKASGTPHVGNYYGAIRPALGLADTHDAFFFIADAHGLTTITDPRELRRFTREIAASWLAAGLDPERAVLYRQSDVPELFELAWVLACVTAKGVLNRAHAYKAAVQENASAGRPPDDGVNAGLFTYPVLMAADILAFHADVVPVGADQEQHVEITRDVAGAFNRTFQQLFGLPDALTLPLLPGVDGRKMSKSYANTIPAFAPADGIRRRVMRIVTDSRRPEEPKDPDTCNVFGIYRHVADAEAVEAMRRRYLEGGVAYREIKEELAALLSEELAAPRARYEELMSNPEHVESVLAEGARRAAPRAAETLDRVREITGTRRRT